MARVVVESVLLASFSEVNNGVELDTALLPICTGICAKYNLSEEEFSSKWDAFVTRVGCDAKPTEKTLAVFRSEIDKQIDKQQIKKRAPIVEATIDTLEDFGLAMETDLYGSYGLELTPEQIAAKAAAEERAAQLASQAKYQTPRKGPPRSTPSKTSPAGKAPLTPVHAGTLAKEAATPPSTAKKYHERENKNKIEMTLRPALPPLLARRDVTGATLPRTKVALHQDFVNFRYMYDKVGNKVAVLNKKIEDIGEDILERARLGSAVAHNMPLQEPLVTIGRICCDTEGRLNPTSAMLEGTQDLCSGSRVPLDLSQLEFYSFFPGQVVAVEGLNQTGSKLLVQRFFDGGAAATAMDSREDMCAYHWNGASLEEDDHGRTTEVSYDFMLGAPLSIIVASGPYTTTENLDFEPFMDLLARVKEEQPDVLILMGPFLDEEHPMIADNMLPHTLDEIFQDRISAALDEVLGGPTGLGQRDRTRVVMIPSLRDVNHDHVFPQPPFAKNLEIPPWVLRMPNPAFFTINEMTVAVSTTDIIKDLSAEELPRMPAEGSDRMSRLAGHVIQQRNVYPLFPTPPRTQLDFTQAERLEMPWTPDVLILPSSLRYFVKELGDTVVVNPGRLTVGMSGGTFARLSVHPLARDAVLDPRRDDDDAYRAEMIKHRVAERTRSEIVRI